MAKSQFLALVTLMGMFAEQGFDMAQAKLSNSSPLDPTARPDRGQLGIFMVLVFGAVALVVVSIVLLFGQDIAGEFADGINVDNEYSDAANSTVNSTGDAFELFGTSVLVIPAAAVLAVLIGGLIGAVTMVGGGALPGMGGGMRRGGR
jgi:ABC-type Fe3+ transport system permease subunit